MATRRISSAKLPAIVNKNQTKIAMELPISYLQNTTKDSDFPLVILLHGFMDSASSLSKKLLPTESKNLDWLIPNGPFPTPVKDGADYKEAYSWYFEDPRKQVSLVPPAFGAELIDKLLANLALSSREMWIVGFSQGGFLMPWLARRLSNLKGLVGIGCDYLAESYQGLSPIPVYAIHGTDDDVISLDSSRKNWQQLKALKFPGEFMEIPSGTHRLEEPYRKALSQILKAQPHL